MGLITPLWMQLPVRRPTEDADGNKTFTNLGTGSPPTIQCVVALAAPAKQRWRAHEDRYIQDGQLCVPRGSDIKAGDEIQYGGFWYNVVGQPLGNHDHPLTGQDFGVVVYTLSGGG